jgi:hypothetical protein
MFVADEAARWIEVLNRGSEEKLSAAIADDLTVSADQLLAGVHFGVDRERAAADHRRYAYGEPDPAFTQV